MFALEDTLGKFTLDERVALHHVVYVIHFIVLCDSNLGTQPSNFRGNEPLKMGGWPQFANVFALGDSSSLPTSKTAASIASQALPFLTVERD